MNKCKTLLRATLTIKQAIPKDALNEHFIVIGTDNQMNTMFVNTVVVGSSDRACINIRDVFTTALLGKAVGLILGHNHPKASAFPSDEDMDITIRLWKGGQILGIDVLDHIIIGEEDVFSFLQRGWMKKLKAAADTGGFPENVTGNLIVELAPNIKKLYSSARLASQLP